MPAGYGNVDDVLGVIQTNIDNGIDHARSQLRGTGTTHCLECGEEIPAARKKALPSSTHCVDCADGATAYSTPFNRRAHHDALLR